jgi:uncharacterized protein with GYD domain
LRAERRGANVTRVKLRREDMMPKFLFRGSLTSEGVAGVMKEGGTARRAAAEQAVSAVGGTLEAFYFAFGDDDVILICDLPDNETAAGLAMEISSTGPVSVSTTVLLTPDEMDRAREHHSGFRAPGR